MRPRDLTVTSYDNNIILGRNLGEVGKLVQEGCYIVEVEFLPAHPDGKLSMLFTSLAIKLSCAVPSGNARLRYPFRTLDFTLLHLIFSSQLHLIVFQLLAITLSFA